MKLEMKPAENDLTAVKVWHASAGTERHKSAKRTTWTMTTNAPRPEAIASKGVDPRAGGRGQSVETSVAKA